MGNAGLPPGPMGQAQGCALPSCRIFGTQLAKKGSSDSEWGTITVKMDPSSVVEHSSWPPPCVPISEELRSSSAQAGVPRSWTRVPEGGGCCQMREAAEEAAAAAEAAEADRRSREEKLRQELDERRAAEAFRRAEAEAERRRREEAARHRREARDEVARATIARHAREEAEAREKVGDFLARRGFGGARDSRRRRLRSSGPLHVAVEENDSEMVRLLLQAGADPAQRDSSGRTPQELARKRNRRGSHERVLSMLAAV